MNYLFYKESVAIEPHTLKDRLVKYNETEAAQCLEYKNCVHVMSPIGWRTAYLEGLGGQCGIAVLCNLDFWEGDNDMSQQFWKKVDTVLKTLNYSYLMVTVTTKQTVAIKILTDAGFKETHRGENRRSGNTIITLVRDLSELYA